MSFVWMLLFTNAQLFFWIKDDAEVVDWNQKTITTDNSVSLMIEWEKEAKESLEKKQKELDLLVSQYENNFNIIEIFEPKPVFLFRYDSVRLWHWPDKNVSRNFSLTERSIPPHPYPSPNGTSGDPGRMQEIPGRGKGFSFWFARFVFPFDEFYFS